MNYVADRIRECPRQLFRFPARNPRRKTREFAGGETAVTVLTGFDHAVEKEILQFQIAALRHDRQTLCPAVQHGVQGEEAFRQCILQGFTIFHAEFLFENEAVVYALRLPGDGRAVAADQRRDNLWLALLIATISSVSSFCRFGGRRAMALTESAVAAGA